MIKSEEVEKLFTDEEIRALLEGMSPYWDAEEAYRDFEDENLTQKELDFIGSAPQIIRQLSKENERLKEKIKSMAELEVGEEDETHDLEVRGYTEEGAEQHYK